MGRFTVLLFAFVLGAVILGMIPLSGVSQTGGGRKSGTSSTGSGPIMSQESTIADPIGPTSNDRGSTRQVSATSTSVISSSTSFLGKPVCNRTAYFQYGVSDACIRSSSNPYWDAVDMGEYLPQPQIPMTAASVVISFPGTTLPFDEEGLVTGTLWSVTLDGSTLSSTTSTIGFAEPNGTYPYSITPVSGYDLSSQEGIVSVNGSAVTELLSFVPSTRPDFMIGSTPSTLTAHLGETAMSTIDVTAMNGLSGNVTLSESTMPPSSRISCSLGPVEVLVTSSSSSKLSCTADGVGSYNVTVTAGYNTDSRSVTHTTTVSITFALPEADFTITTLSSAPVETGKHAVSTITITPVNGFTGQVRLTVQAPSNVSCGATSPDIIETSGNATLSCSSILPGTYEVIITATSGSRIHTQTLSITVNEEEIPDDNTSSSLILGLPQTMIYGILGGAIVAILAAGSAVANRTSKKPPNGKFSVKECFASRLEHRSRS